MSIRTATVGVVTASPAQPLGYDPASQKVSVTVQMRQVVKNPEVSQGPGSIVTLPAVLLQNIPVAWPRTSKGYITFPLSLGDSGELIIQDRALQLWLASGKPVDPKFNWTHNINDSVFHPGLHSDLDPLPATDLTGTVVEGDPTIKLGRSAVLGVARLTDTVSPDATMAASLAQIITAVNVMAAQFNIAGPIVGAPGTVTPVTPPVDFGIITSSSTKVLSE